MPKITSPQFENDSNRQKNTKESENLCNQSDLTKSYNTDELNSCIFLPRVDQKYELN